MRTHTSNETPPCRTTKALPNSRSPSEHRREEEDRKLHQLRMGLDMTLHRTNQLQSSKTNTSQCARTSRRPIKELGLAEGSTSCKLTLLHSHCRPTNLISTKILAAQNKRTSNQETQQQATHQTIYEVLQGIESE
jgi:hypothetical protein